MTERKLNKGGCFIDMSLKGRIRLWFLMQSTKYRWVWKIYEFVYHSRYKMIFEKDTHKVFMKDRFTFKKKEVGRWA